MFKKIKSVKRIKECLKGLKGINTVFCVSTFIIKGESVMYTAAP